MFISGLNFSKGTEKMEYAEKCKDKKLNESTEILGPNITEYNKFIIILTRLIITLSIIKSFVYHPLNLLRRLCFSDSKAQITTLLSRSVNHPY